jgi:hypothetical protein
MSKIVKAVFVRKYEEDIGRERDIEAYEFVFVPQGDKKKVDYYGFFTETKLLQYASLKKDHIYEIELSEDFRPDSKRQPYPVSIKTNNATYIKQNSSIIKIDKFGNRENLSISIFQMINRKIVNKPKKRKRK